MIKLFGLGDKKKPEKNPKMGKGFVPTDRVKDMSKKGFSEPEIIDALRKEGFDAKEIDRALTQALKVGVTGEPEEKENKIPTLQELQSRASQQPPKEPPMPSFPQPEQTEQVGPQMPEEMPYEGQQYYPPSQDYGTEELIESVVHEKAGEFDRKFTEMKAKNMALERRLADLHNQLTMMSKGRTQTEEAILTKIEVFKESLDDIGAHLSSLEKAFKDALPALIESVRSLTDLVNRIKKEKA